MNSNNSNPPPRPLQFHDVGADGNCFYAALIAATEASIDPFLLRSFVAKSLLIDQSLLGNLYNVLRACPQVRSNYPLASGCTNVDQDAFMLACQSNVQRNDVWASEVEHTVMKKALCDHGIDLLTCFIKRPRELRDERHMYGLLLEIISKQSTQALEKCIILININNQHYMYMTCLDRGIISKRVLRRAICVPYDR